MIIMAAVGIYLNFMQMYSCPQWEHIDTFDTFIEENLTEEQAEVFTDEFIYNLLKTCEEEDMDPWFAISTMQNESAFNPDAIAYDGKHFGLMQLSEKYHLQKLLDNGGEDLFNPLYNMITGIQYMGDIKRSISQFNSLKESKLDYPMETLISMSYNQGLGTALPKFKEEEISDYTQKVIQTYATYKTKYGTINIEEILSDYEVPLNVENYIKEIVE